MPGLDPGSINYEIVLRRGWIAGLKPGNDEWKGATGW
jgi:hypothetical protein